MVIHYKDFVSKESECGKGVRLSAMDIEIVDCMECLVLVKTEWERQTREFTGQPRINAEVGLRRTIERIKDLEEKD